MPCCSANDVLDANGVPVKSALTASPTGTTTTVATGDASVATSGGPCWREVCEIERLGGERCPNGRCKYGEPPGHSHERPPCPDHPWGSEPPSK